MPRKSTAEMTTPSAILPIKKITPPASLVDTEAEHFRAIVASKPEGFFQRCDVPLIVELSRHLSRADEIARHEKKARESADFDAGDFDMYARLADRETRSIASLMTKLRVTPQARYRADSAKHSEVPSGPKPWEFGTQARG